jgi:photosystem II stability/assembly factor-like uncharacterized protein
MSNFSCEIAYPTTTNGNTVNLDPTQTWTAATGIPSQVPWQSVSISSNGVNAIACSGSNSDIGINSYIYYSTNSLVTWNLSIGVPTSNEFYSVSISDTGYALACGTGYILLSNNNGQTWTQAISDNPGWYRVSISKNGEYAIAGLPNTDIYYSSLSVDFTTWTPCNLSVATWNGLSMSNTGLYALACAENSEHVYYSSNYGHTWTKTSSKLSETDYILSVSISSTGQYGIAIGYSSSYYSSDYGQTWAQSNLIIEQFTGVGSVSMSSTEQYCLACASGIGDSYYIYLSSNYGHTWTASPSTIQYPPTSSTAGWTSVSISATGQYAVACQYQLTQYIESSSVNYISFDAYVNIETDLVYVFNEDKDGTNLIPYTTNIVKNTTDLGTLFKNQYNTTSTLTTKYNTTIGYVDINDSTAIFSQPTTPPSQSTNLYYVDISSSGQYRVACVNGGLIYYSHDYGVTWASSTIQPSAQSYTSISISDNGYALACVYDGLIYYSSDNGQTWTQSNSYPSLSWQSVSISKNNKYAIACVFNYDNYLGDLYYSSDNGVTWDKSSSKSSDETGWVSVSISSTGQYGLASVGYGGGIFYTTDYGVTWPKTNADENLGFTPFCISVSISSTGQYGVGLGLFSSIGNGNNVYYSSDYCINWTQSITILEGSYVEPPSSASISISSTGQYGLACGYYTKFNIYNVIFGIYYSNDYGKTWTHLSSTINNYYSSVAISSTGQYALTGLGNNNNLTSGCYLYNIEFPTTTTIVDLSTILQPINPAYWTISSSQSGLPWWSVSISSTGQYGLACAYMSSGYIYYSSDYGQSWTPVLNTSVSGYIWTSVSISSTGQYGLACCFYDNSIDVLGGIYYSSDYGQSWNAALITVESIWYSVSISSTGQYGIACSLGSSIYYSSDPGFTWTVSNSPSTYNWYNVSISSSGQYGLACVNDGNLDQAYGIFYSSDYGINWTQADNTSGYYWFNVSLSGTGQYGLACGAVDNPLTTVYIYYSNDYGHTWTQSTVGQSASISSTGQYAIAGSGGYIYYSNDFGHTWSISNSPSGLNLQSVSISGTGQYGLAGADGGSIYYLNG